MWGTRCLGLVGCIWLSVCINSAFAVERVDDESFFELKIRPVLAAKCFSCHGGKKVSGGLRVDSREALLKGGDEGAALVQGDPDASLIVQAIRYTHESIRMPPDRKLPESIAADFAEWIKRGAHWPAATAASSSFVAEKHWAFEPVRDRQPPPDDSRWSENPIDRFLAKKREERGLKVVAQADRRTLLRRVSFDLTGLPPTPQEIADFEADEAPDAYERLVERLLASPRYGERWGRFWMDVVRYADTAGDNADYPIPEVRLYRDYIIDAFNTDKPYNQFIHEQLAGDILAREGPREAYADRVIATGFLALSRRYATAPEELWHLTLEDTIETTGRAFLGLTLRCARCHDHKFDPVTKEDYYALYGIFASTQFPYAGSEEFQSKGLPRDHFVPLIPPDESKERIEANQRRIAELEKATADNRGRPYAREIADLDRRLAELSTAIQGLEAIDQMPRALKGQRVRLKGQRAALLAQQNPWKDELLERKRRGAPPDLPLAYAVGEGRIVDEAVQVRGEPGNRGAIVPRSVPKSLVGKNSPRFTSQGSGRRELAEWLTRPENPLTARVMVNRVWQHLFGKGIVATPSNFGIRGELPTHPELLDWLSARFVDSGWSIKSMIRLIVHSKSYQLSSEFQAEGTLKDPSNQTYWRHDRRRLDAEAIRDGMLMLGGDLDLERPGTHPFPPITNWAWTQHSPFKAVYASNHRSVYLMTQRLQRHPYLSLFDGPDTNNSTDVRTSSTVPLQALYLMNNPFVRQEAEGFARRLRNISSDESRRAHWAITLAWNRPPKEGEIESCLAYVHRVAEQCAGPSDQREHEAWTSLAKVMLASNEFLYVD